MAQRRRRVPLRRFSHRQAVACLLLLAMLVLLRWWHAQPDVPAQSVYRVERVVDGDTLLLANRYRVRLIGADTPETVKPDHPVEPWGPEATRFTKQFVAGGEVRLEFDGPRQDEYGRHLAYVWVGDRMLNEELIREGLATAKTQFPYASEMKARFLRAQNEAQAARRGIWSP